MEKIDKLMAGTVCLSFFRLFETYKNLVLEKTKSSVCAGEGCERRGKKKKKKRTRKAWVESRKNVINFI